MTAAEVFANDPTATITSGGNTAPSPGTVETWTANVTRPFAAAATGTSAFHLTDIRTDLAYELIAVTNGAGTVGTHTWTVTRGAEGTTPVAHSSPFAVIQVVSAGAYATFAQAGQGDLGGTGASPSVLKVNGVTISGTPAAGAVPYASSPTAAAWTPFGVPLKSGWWYPQDGGGGTMTLIYQQAWAWPFDCQRAITLSQMAINVKTGGVSGSLIRMGVYASDGAGFIGNLLLDAGTVTGSATGVQTLSGLATAMGPDRLWLLAVYQGTNGSAPQVQAYAHASPSVGWSSYNQFPSVVAYQFTGIAGALPGSLGAASGFENNVAPAVQFSPA